MRTHRRRPDSRRPLTLLAAGAVALVTASPAVGQTPEEIMGEMAELGIEFVGVSTDIPDRQPIGQRNTTHGLVRYAWDAQPSADDRVAREHLLSVDHLRVAGIPAVPGSSPEFESGMYGNSRYRLGGTLTDIEIRGESRYEIRVNFDWQLYDTESSSVIWEGSTRGMARGAVLGDRGEADNTLLDAVLKALESPLEEKIPEAIEAAGG